LKNGSETLSEGRRQKFRREVKEGSGVTSSYLTIGKSGSDLSNQFNRRGLPISLAIQMWLTFDYRAGILKVRSQKAEVRTPRKAKKGQDVRED
jgi:hypothetical protein